MVTNGRRTGGDGVAHEVLRRSEWVGTRLRFELAPAADGSTELRFEHEGLEPTLECFELCRAGWQQFLGSLQRFVETGRGEPYRLASAR